MNGSWEGWGGLFAIDVDGLPAMGHQKPARAAVLEVRLQLGAGFAIQN
ncbi:MAG: hypothetical protein ACRD1C_03515 [Terriglobales bacterium]